MTDDQEPGEAPGGETIGWLRAIASGIAIVIVGFALTVVAANSILTRFTGMSRTTRQDLASIVFLVVVVLIAWALRRLQARGLV